MLGVASTLVIDVKKVSTRWINRQRLNILQEAPTKYKTNFYNLMFFLLCFHLKKKGDLTIRLCEVTICADWSIPEASTKWISHFDKP